MCSYNNIMDLSYELLCILFFIFNINTATCFSKFKTVTQSSGYSDSIFLDSLQLLQSYNYSSEKHVVVTEDGYKLNIFRIPRKGSPVLLVHGIGDSSDSWLVLGPKHSLAYQLADAGFDVWLFNARGNRYCKEHIKNISQKLFWDFSYEEIGSYDLPATVNYILSETRYSKVSYVGFSQGSTTFFVMCSMRPEFNKKINHAILLAPVAWLKHTKYPLIDFFSKSLNILTWIAETQQVYEAFPFNEKLNLYHASVCDTLSPVRMLCELELFVNFGLQKLSNLLPEKLPVITSHIPAGTSSKVFLHFIQGYSTQRFQRYDYGVSKNLEVYSSTFPPVYDVSLVSAPVTLVSSEVDWFSDVEDVSILKRKLNSVAKSVHINGSLQFTHLEFVYGARVNSVINKPVLNILEGLRKK
ncbi:lipase 3-like [Maniola jurtina]|uniref:lipase 3-like n=1 Tax=Maniola jurtina TaxID=191418 RepID=UPI001E68C3A5|nr:lipase 3-like [Maniola jurtina]